MPWKTAEELRDLAGRLRVYVLTETDAEVLSELQAMIAELERRARAQENGGATGACWAGLRAPAPPPPQVAPPPH